MWGWVIGSYAVFVFVVSGGAAYVALVVTDDARRQMGYRVLKLVLGTGTGTGGVLALSVKLHAAGIL